MPGNDPFKGHASQIAVGVESTQGTSVAPTRHLAKIEEETEHPDPEINWYEERVIGGDRELHGKSLGQRVYEGGTYPCIVVDPLPLAWALGAESFDGTDTSTLTPKMDGKPPALTVEAALTGRGGGTDFVREFTGVVADSCTFGTDNDDRLTAEIDAIALGVDPNASETSVGSYPTGDPWIWSDISSDISIGGTSFARLTDWEIGIENNVSARHYITSSVTTQGDPYEILYGNVGYDFSATIVADDDALYQEVVSTSATATVDLEFTRSNGDLLSITLSGVDLTEAPYPTPRGEDADDEVVEVEASGIPEGLTIDVQDTVNSAAVL